LSTSDEEAVALTARRKSAFSLGMKACYSPAAVVLALSFFGFGAFAREGGMSLAFTMLISFFVWALPGQVVLVSEMAAGATILAAALAVTLTAVRLMPLVVTLMPILREPRTSKWQQYLLSHFLAITVWVEAMRNLPAMPRDMRIPFYVGFCLVLFTLNIFATAAGFLLAGILSAKLAAGLLFLTPIYFVLSLMSVSVDLTNRLALGFGFVLGPVFFAVIPGYELLFSGLVGGTAAYAIARLHRSRV
jgi:predicted branched-subunit amino acid permease